MPPLMVSELMLKESGGLCLLVSKGRLNGVVCSCVGIHGRRRLFSSLLRYFLLLSLTNRYNSKSEMLSASRWKR